MAKMTTNNHLEKDVFFKNPFGEFFAIFLLCLYYGSDYQEPKKKVEYS